MSELQDLIRYMFAGCADPLTRVMRQSSSGTSPNGVVTAPQGTFLIIDYSGNAADHDVYINTDGSTAWTQIHNETA